MLDRHGDGHGAQKPPVAGHGECYGDFSTVIHDWYDSQGILPRSGMAYFKDLTRYEYSKNVFGCVGEPLNIGWIERCATYPKGVVDRDLLSVYSRYGLHARGVA